MTLAPNAWASWMAATPMPLVPPCTRNHSPAFSPPRSNTLCQTVKKPSGIAAASTMEMPSGTGRQEPSSATQYSA